MTAEVTSLVDRAEGLMRSKDYAGAATAADAVLSNLVLLSRAAVVRGNAMLFPLLDQIMDGSRENPSRAALQEALEMFTLAMRLDPENATARTEAQNMQSILEMILPGGWADQQHGHPHQASAVPAAMCPSGAESFDVVVVGAGASGVGMALMLTRVFRLDSRRVLLLERGGAVGETFRHWPREMRFISPSFNQQGWTSSFDLNSVAFGTSPAFTLHAEHPTGAQYAAYLGDLAETAGLCVRLHTEVLAVRTRGAEGGFEIETVPVGGGGGRGGLGSDGAATAAPMLLQSRFVIWAAGEFQYPTAVAANSPPRPSPSFPGSELCLHNSSVQSWGELPGDDFVVIGGYESGMDAASNLATCGKRCTVVSSTAYWDVVTADPSTELSPYTAERVRAARASAVPPRLLAPLRVVAVEAADEASAYLVRARWGPPVEHPGGQLRTTLHAARAAAAASDCAEGSELTLRTPQPPLLCTGFAGSVAASAVVRDLFEWGQPQSDRGGEGGCSHGSPRLTEQDESTKTPGLFLVGPAVRHGELSFCFIYKFRQRFAIVADVIARGLGLCTEEAVKQCRKTDMYMDDLECCQAACGEAC
mmetsp:Transcript_54393/g.122991  ORF Transcript_54393/g.122991 Transcript_54393/m.122991 type:complete len:590 (+) Transcript_54393:126-1895(+)